MTESWGRSRDEGDVDGGTCIARASTRGGVAKLFAGVGMVDAGVGAVDAGMVERRKVEESFVGRPTPTQTLEELGGGNCSDTAGNSLYC